MLCNDYDLKLLADPMPSWMARGVFLLAAALLLGGCSSQRHLMPTPDIYALGMMQPFADKIGRASCRERV